MAEFSYIGKGEILVAPYDGSAGLRKIGNVKDLKFSVSEEEKSVQDYQSSGGGKANSISRITGVSLAVSMMDRIAENIALATKGASSAVAAGAATDEVHTGYHGQYIALLNHVVPTSIVVKDSTAVTTYVLDTDYTVDANGLIKILSTGSITDGETLKVSYSYVAHNAVQALVNAGIEYKAVFVGLNEAQSDKPVVVTVHRLKFGAAKDYSLISDDFSPLDIEGQALKDAAITGAGLSQYFKVQQQEA